jgi:putative FmdB family regulatory protein
MPIYDYECSECGKRYDVFHKVREIAEDVLCPTCGSRNHKKLMSAPSISISSRATSAENPDCPSCDLSEGGCAGGMCGLN